MIKEQNNIVIIIQAQDSTDKLKIITNACEITVEQFKEIYASLQLL
jgi:5,10-methenyltetrahydromethanopterin hydrogenase